YSSTVPKDSVIDQDPEPGFTGTTGQKVNLVVSRGPQLVPVPDVEGDTQEEAETKLKAAGFQVNVVFSSEGSCAFFEGIVCDQNPDAGTLLEKGKTVTITVGQSPFEPTPTPSES
ncbi:MAG: PASTA domain-containing protein, partial [Actinomycetota bacterium]